MSFLRFIAGILSVWRITHLLNGEDGPGDVFVRLRRLAGQGFWGSLLDCFYCLSLWVAVPFALFLGKKWKDRLVLITALSGGAILLERLTAGEQKTQVPFYIEDEEDSHVMLRRKKE
jgi:hypothetical protein